MKKSNRNVTRGSVNRVGLTRKVKIEPKKARKLAKAQRIKNVKIANKKFRPSGSKKRR
jgi:hypothetical protein